MVEYCIFPFGDVVAVDSLKWQGVRLDDHVGSFQLYDSINEDWVKKCTAPSPES